MIRLAFILLAGAAQAQSDAPLDGFTFDKQTLGNAYTIYRDGGEPYGITTFHANRQVTWLRFGEICTAGTWSEPEPGLICFEYPHRATPACWSYFHDGDKLRLHWQGNPEDAYYYGDPSSDVTTCDAPYIGS